MIWGIFGPCIVYQTHLNPIAEGPEGSRDVETNKWRTCHQQIFHDTWLASDRSRPRGDCPESAKHFMKCKDV